MNNHTPADEIASRLNRFQALLQQYLSQAEGSLVFSRLNIFYFTGSFANGVLWLPREGKPILFCRRGIERAAIESSVEVIVPFNSYGDIPKTFNEYGLSQPSTIAAEMGGLPWALANSLLKYLPEVKFQPADRLIAMTRAKKSEWELRIIREAGARHDKCLTQLLPPLLQEGINELEISHRLSELFFAQGHHGILRMETFGEEAYLGHIAVGDSANYPSVFNGPVGLRGAHPAVPFMGAEEVCWTAGYPLTIDNGFTLAGYHTDKTQVYWLGSRSSIPDHLQAAHDFCVELLARIAAQLRPGAIPSSIWRECEELALQSAWADGFMGLGNNKVRFVGHGIGLAIDEYPVLAKGFDQPLEEGMVLAIEPKIGISGLGMVGTENTFEVTAEGGKSVSGSNYDIITIEG
ncbi:MAG: M24 family metallopeptidase [Thermodesulfobacteriota bacterium]